MLQLTDASSGSHFCTAKIWLRDYNSTLTTIEIFFAFLQFAICELPYFFARLRCSLCIQQENCAFFEIGMWGTTGLSEVLQLCVLFCIWYTEFRNLSKSCCHICNNCFYTPWHKKTTSGQLNLAVCLHATIFSKGVSIFTTFSHIRKMVFFCRIFSKECRMSPFWDLDYGICSRRVAVFIMQWFLLYPSHAAWGGCITTYMAQVINAFAILNWVLQNNGGLSGGKTNNEIAKIHVYFGFRFDSQQLCTCAFVLHKFAWCSN